MNGENDPRPPANEQYRQILAEAESIAELFVDESYPLLAKHTGGAQVASLAINVACAMRLADALYAHTAAVREQSDAIRQQTK